MREFSEFKILNHLPLMEKILRGENNAPITVEIDPSNECNHRCIWCIDGKHRSEHPEKIDRDVLFRAVEEMARMGVKGLVIKGGGEPLTYEHFADLLLHVRELGMKVGIITNGELIDEHEEVILKTCEWLRISVDAGTLSTHDRVHRPQSSGAFLRILHNIREVSGRIYTGVIYVVHPHNFHEMARMATLARKAGCRYIAFKKVILPNRDMFTPELLMAIDSAYLYAKKSQENESFKVIGFRIYDFTNNGKPRPYGLCKAHRLIGIVCADGNLYTCCSTRGNPDYCYGSLKDESFDAIWNGPRRAEILERIDAGVCRELCVGKTSYMRYDHYNELAEYLADTERPHRDFL